MTALLAKEMTSYADTFPLNIANPKPVEWTPPLLEAFPEKKQPNDFMQSNRNDGKNNGFYISTMLNCFLTPSDSYSTSVHLIRSSHDKTSEFFSSKRIRYPCVWFS